VAEPLALHVHRAELAGPVGPVVEVALRIPSDVAHVEAAVELLARHCLEPVGPARRTAFRFRVAVAEALANAIVCGNRADPSLAVAVRAECHPAELRVHVTDEGTGFDPAAVPDPIGTDDLERACGRGLFLIRNLSDSVEFSPRGNSLCMTFRLP
jgi:anti-sigma regulatory factor (Ser/Thr protein kinase)